MTHRIELEPGSPEWAAQQALAVLALQASRSTDLLHPQTPLAHALRTGLRFIVNRMENTTLYTRTDVDFLIQRTIGAASVLLHMTGSHWESSYHEYETLLNHLINTLHTISLSLSDARIAARVAELEQAHELLKELRS